VDEIVEVGEDEMLDAMDWLDARERVIAEPSGAAATAAYLRGIDSSDGPTVLLVTGANVSPDATALLTARRQRVRGPRP
jgi:threonine dehydratase